jgi:hypothetical protein
VAHDDDSKQESDQPDAGSEQHPHVQRIRPDPSQPPQRVLTLSGLRGDSDRAGYRRIYFTRELDYFAEFRTEDLLGTESIPADQPPLVGLEATRVILRRDATINFTRTRQARALDEFDLDVRLGGGPSGGQAQPALFTGFRCTFLDGCDTGRTCDTCRTDCDQHTCNTCQTQCNQDTCLATCTCQTQCGQDTCQTCQTACGTCQTACGTCFTQCGQDTCGTCDTNCHQQTCHTCDTCNPHVFTCGNQPQCRL